VKVPENGATDITGDVGLSAMHGLAALIESRLGATFLHFVYQLLQLFGKIWVGLSFSAKTSSSALCRPFESGFF